VQVIVRKWRRFSNLTGFERAVAVEAAAALSATWLGLRLVGFCRWKSVLIRLAPPLPRERLASSTVLPAQVISRMEAAAARNLFFRPTCLERSMVLWWLLRSRGIPAKLRVGGRKTGQRFEAHAWVESDGTALNQPEEIHRRFMPFDAPIASTDAPAN
jgi:Transglutaminase-like superfamily